MPKLWSVTLYLETDDRAVVEEISNKITGLACPIDPQQDHACEPPWFVITSDLGSDDDDETTAIRELLNR